MSKYCIKCGAEIDDQGRFCPVCGTDQLPKIEPTNVICPKCGTTYPIGVKFCTKCGFQLGKAHSNDNPNGKKQNYGVYWNFYTTNILLCFASLQYF